jgi:acyl-CoA synthetase (AMP-forming)/AMP-acid ligase II
MIKTSGYRVSPTEVEEIVYATGLVDECVAFGVEHPTLGNAIHLIAACAASTGFNGINGIKNECQLRMPAYMVPSSIEVVTGPLPRNPNGKIDRKQLSDNWVAQHGS